MLAKIEVVFVSVFEFSVAFNNLGHTAIRLKPVTGEKSLHSGSNAPKGSSVTRSASAA